MDARASGSVLLVSSNVAAHFWFDSGRCDSIEARGAILCLETKVGVGSFENAFEGAAKASEWRNLHRLLPRSGEIFENESRETSIPRLETVEINQEIHLWEECF